MRYAHLSESRLYRHGHHWWRWSCNEIDVISWSNSNLTSWIGVECWCDFGANLVQHFMRRYSRYSRYCTKSHDKSTISHDISRYSRYQTVFLKLEEIISTEGRNLQKRFCNCRAFFVISWSFGNAVWYREYRQISCDIVALSCDFVRYREYREYRRIKCCTKFAPTHTNI